ncbi:MAG: ABC transporter ATP-binding protein [Proteobacteria bacterium]|nr:ABC transporter ATP-binding protein [Pseudomonadota bacterium]
MGRAVSAALLEIDGLSQAFPVRGGWLGRAIGVVRAVQDVSFTIARGEVVALVGESGSGKTTIGRAVLRLLRPTAGRIRFDGTDIAGLPEPALRPYRKRMQPIFQDPYASLDPRMRVEEIVGEAFDVYGLPPGRDRRQRVAALLRQVGLDDDHLDRYPHEFSGGQRQRIGIARALAVQPELLIADEPVSALDVSIQAQVVNLLQDLQSQLGLAMLFISHDLAVVQALADRVVVLYLGRIVESGPAQSVFAAPRHPYTMALLDAAPVPDPTRRRDRVPLQGEVPSPLAPPSGCVFRTRCPYALPACAGVVPPPRNVGPDHTAACIRDDLPSP